MLYLFLSFVVLVFDDCCLLICGVGINSCFNGFFIDVMYIVGLYSFSLLV